MEFMKQQWIHEQQDKLSRYRILNELAKKGQILFTGSSLMEQFPINELLMTSGISRIIYNRGIGGFTTADMLNNMDVMVFGTKPSRIFINIGTNDIGSTDCDPKALLENYENILRQIRERLPETEVNMLAYYPVNEVDKVPEDEMGRQFYRNRTNKNIQLANEANKKLAEKMDCNFIDVNDGLADENGRLKKEYTIDGTHMYANGYQIVFDNLKKYL